MKGFLFIAFLFPMLCSLLFSMSNLKIEDIVFCYLSEYHSHRKTEDIVSAIAGEFKIVTL